MPDRALLGLAPYLPRHRPRAAARWWIARAALRGERIEIASLEEQEGLPVVDALAGLAAPCTLPRAFLAHLDRLPAECTAERLCRETRLFAATRNRGDRHPPRHPQESLSALDRRRLPLHHAALPLLAQLPLIPFAATPQAAPALVEVDVPALLRSRDLPHRALTGDLPAAVDARARVLKGLDALVLDDLAHDRAVANHDALRAIVSVFAAAVVSRCDALPLEDGAEAWFVS